MSTDQVLEIVRERGMDVVLKNGTPVIVKPQNNPWYTDALVKVLTKHREEIIRRLIAKESK